MAGSPVSSTAVRALRVLEILAESGEPVSIAEVARRLGMEKVTAYRMLITLEHTGYVAREDASKRFRLSYKVVSLSRNLLAENEVSRLVQEKLREISDETKETLHYSVLDGFEAVLVHAVRGTQVLSVNFQIGDRSPLHATSIGKALLAYQDEKYIEQIFDQGLTSLTDRTIVEPAELRPELELIRKRGYALDDKEFSPNTRCIAVPVIQGDLRVQSGISISGPTSRFSNSYLDKLKEPMLRAASQLSRHLGGMPWHEA